MYLALPCLMLRKEYVVFSNHPAYNNEIPLSHLSCLLPTASYCYIHPSIMNYHKLGNLKQQKFIPSQPGVQ